MPAAAVTFQDSRHAEWALWQLATDAKALAPQWLRTALRNHAAAVATRYEASSRATKGDSTAVQRRGPWLRS